MSQERNKKELDLIEYKNTLFNKKIKLNQLIESINQEILQTTILIGKECMKKNNGHKWITERENCMYGELFTYCEYCNIDYSDSSYMH